LRVAPWDVVRGGEGINLLGAREFFGEMGATDAEVAYGPARTMRPVRGRRDTEGDRAG
jgi:hypothetical protein